MRCSVRPVFPFGWPPPAAQSGRAGSTLHWGEEGESGSRPWASAGPWLPRSPPPGPSLLGVVLKEQCWSHSSCQSSTEGGESTRKLTSSKKTQGEKQIPVQEASARLGETLQGCFTQVEGALVALGLLTFSASLSSRGQGMSEQKHAGEPPAGDTGPRHGRQPGLPWEPRAASGPLRSSGKRLPRPSPPPQPPQTPTQRLVGLPGSFWFKSSAQDLPLRPLRLTALHDRLLCL